MAEDAGMLFDVAHNFFTNDEWPHAASPRDGFFSLPFQGQNGHWTCFAQVDEPTQRFVFYSVCPVAAPEPRRLALAEFLTRANYGLVIGNFELDMNDGEIRYKTSLDVEGVGLSPELLQHCVYPNVLTMDQYLPGILAVITTDTSPTEALARVEL
jgi:hypothetical protein